MAVELVAEYECGTQLSLDLPRHIPPGAVEEVSLTRGDRRAVDGLIKLLDARHRRTCLDCSVDQL